MEIDSNHIIIREIQSDIQQLEKVESLIQLIFKRFHLKGELRFRVQLALFEAVNNSIKHGNQLEDSRTVIITCLKLKSNLIRLSVKDEGCGFDESKLKNPTDKQLLEKPNGRGVFLIKELCDDVQFFDGGRITQMDFMYDID